MITEARGSSAAFEAQPPSPMEEALLRIREMDTVDDQLAALLTRYSPYGQDKIPAITTSEELAALFAFASNSESSPSLLVRMQAAERGLQAIFSRDAPAAVAAHRQAIEPAMPTRFFPHLATHFQEPMGQSIFEDKQEERRQLRLSHHLARQLLTDEGFHSDLPMYPDWEEFSYAPAEMPSSQPAMAPLLLGELRADNTADSGMLRQLLPLAEELHTAYPEVFSEVNHVLLHEYAALGGLHRYLEEGHEYRELASDVMVLVGDKAPTLMRQFSEIRHYSPSLAAAFPEDFQEGVLRGMNELLASSLYALRDHYASGKRTDVRLPLNDQADVLPLYLKGDEPLDLLRNLAFCLYRLQYSRSKSAMLVTKNEDYDLYRVVCKTTNAQYAMYIRPEGGYAYDADYEYGNPKKGVEASISLVIDPTLEPGKLIEVGRHRRPGPDNRLSIRIDREGIAPDQRGERGIHQDTRQRQGTASLDVGSVLGNASDWGVKLARFLARGNQLRAESHGKKTTLNHVTNHFSAKHGRAAFFARAARELQTEYRSSSWASLSHLVNLVGRQSVANPSRSRLH